MAGRFDYERTTSYEERDCPPCPPCPKPTTCNCAKCSGRSGSPSPEEVGGAIVGAVLLLGLVALLVWLFGWGWLVCVIGVVFAIAAIGGLADLDKK